MLVKIASEEYNTDTETCDCEMTAWPDLEEVDDLEEILAVISDNLRAFKTFKIIEQKIEDEKAIVKAECVNELDGVISNLLVTVEATAV